MRFGGIVFSFVAAVFVLTSAGSMQSLAQTTPKKAPRAAGAAENGGEEKKPDGSSWVVSCTGTGATKAMRCELFQQVVVSETNQRLLRLTMLPQANGGQDVLSLAMPHGLNLQQGVRLQIDEAEPVTLPFTQSDQGGVYSISLMAPEMVTALKKGNSLKVLFDTLEGKTVTVTMSLIGFSAAHASYTKG